MSYWNGKVYKIHPVLFYRSVATARLACVPREFYTSPSFANFGGKFQSSILKEKPFSSTFKIHLIDKTFDLKYGINTVMEGEKAMEEEKASQVNKKYINLDEFHRNSGGTFDLRSPVPDLTKSEPCCLGIDEAGRGPVLGPMVYSTSYCLLSKEEALKELGFADSKTLNEEQREELFKTINENNQFLGWITRVLSPNYISNEMLRRTKYNLNQISHDTAIWLIKSVLDSGVDLQQVYVDTVGDPVKYQKKLEHEFPQLKITVKAKADALFPIVSAASICAKVTRDRVIQSWTFIENIAFPTDYGSGYPSDPATKEWLAEIVDKVFGFPQFVRFSWSTCRDILEKQCFAVEWDDDDEDEKAEDLKGTVNITSFFGKHNNNHVEVKPHQFFQERCLERVEYF